MPPQDGPVQRTPGEKQELHRSSQSPVSRSPGKPPEPQPGLLQSRLYSQFAPRPFHTRSGAPPPYAPTAEGSPFGRAVATKTRGGGRTTGARSLETSRTWQLLLTSSEPKPQCLARSRGLSWGGFERISQHIPCPSLTFPIKAALGAPLRGTLRWVRKDHLGANGEENLPGYLRSEKEN